MILSSKVIAVLTLSASASTVLAAPCNIPAAVVSIDDHIDVLASQGFDLGSPVTDFLVVPGKDGCYRHMKNGSVYWNNRTKKAVEVHGLILNKWAALGWERGLLKFPVTDETKTPDGKGRFNHFENGSIYWHPSTGAFEVHGDIRQKWASLQWERGFLGYPITDETKTPDGKGRYNHFQGGSIYWSSNFGAFEVHGKIREYWAKDGWEKGYLGYPISDELTTPCGAGGRYSKFQRGYVVYHPQHGTHKIPKGLRDYWEQQGGFCGSFGFPTGEPTCGGGQCSQNFQGGSLSAPGY